jgi:hypothetical protein
MEQPYSEDSNRLPLETQKISEGGGVLKKALKIYADQVKLRGGTKSDGRREEENET